MFKAIARLTLLSTLVATPVQALDHNKIIKHLDHLGITASTGSCGESSNGIVLGTYNYVKNHLCLSNANTTVAEIDNVVIHELVHITQDCLGGGINSPAMGSITSFLGGDDPALQSKLHHRFLNTLSKANKVKHVAQWTAHMPVERRWIEIEAYALENYPSVVLDMFYSCKP